MLDEKIDLSIVIPCKNEAESIPLLIKSLQEYLKKCTSAFEIIFIDDGSTDETIIEIKKNQKPNIHTIVFTKNFGKEYALNAGIKFAHGEWILILDADFQDPIEFIEKMWNLAKNNDYECIRLFRESRNGEPLIRRICAFIFYEALNYFSEIKIINGERDARLFKSSMRQKFLLLNEKQLFLKGSFAKINPKTTWISYPYRQRENGKTAWSFWKLFDYTFSAIIVSSPLFFKKISIITLIYYSFSFLLLIYLIHLDNLTYIIPLTYFSTFIGIVFITLIIFSLKTIYKKNHRSPYIIKEIISSYK